MTAALALHPLTLLVGWTRYVSPLYQDFATLCAHPPSMEEVHTTTFQLKAFKAPGPDGFPPGFFHHFWDTCKTDIFEMVFVVFTRSCVLRTINSTQIVLIPKRENASTMTDFKPISLCNTVYKVVSKIIVNCLQPVMEELISPNQNAFIKGRLISDNIFLASELMTYIHKTRSTNTCWGVAKLDLAKAYDRLS